MKTSAAPRASSDCACAGPPSIPPRPLEGFDFSFNPKLNKTQIFDLATCQFIERHKNALIYGPTGVGKSHLGQALAHEACRRGFDVLFIDTAKMLHHLAGGRADGTLEQRLARYTPTPRRSPVISPHWLTMGDPGWLCLGDR